MGRFNQTVAPRTVPNLAGGEAYEQNHELQLVSLLLTSFGGDSYYQRSDGTATRLRVLIDLVEPSFAARAVLYARNHFGMRSITHVAASLLGHRASDTEWGRRFFRDVVARPDDMLEIIAFHRGRGEKLSGAMKRGFADAFDRFDGYQLAKYRGDGKAFRLLDVVNMLHPTPTEKNADALKALMKNELRSEGTWETMLTQAGQQAETPEQLAAMKAGAWLQLLTDEKLGYMALLKNLRNIITQAPNALPLALQQLQDPHRVAKSKVLPFRFATAYRELLQVPGPHARGAVVALAKAADIACSNVPALPGSTVVALDVSASMGSQHRRIGNGPAASEHGALFAAVLVKALNADLITFNETAVMRQVDVSNSTLGLAESFKFQSGGTNFHSIFQGLGDRPYDRVIILSDMMAWMPDGTATKDNHGTAIPKVALAEYCRRSGADPAIWSFDLAGHGTMQFPERRVRCMAGFSEKVFGVMHSLEEDPHALVNAVRNMPL